MGMGSSGYSRGLGRGDGSEFGGQMGMGSSGYSRGLGRGDGSVGVMHKTSLNCCGEGISGKMMGIRICTIKKLGGCESAGNHGKQTDQELHCESTGANRTV